MKKILPSGFFKTSLPVAVITGGAGFIGSHLSRSLLSKNIKVLCLDNLQTDPPDNIQDLLENKNFFLLESGINKSLPKNTTKVDYVIHLAGAEAYLNSEDISIEILEANSIGCKNLLSLAQEKKARFLLASTIGVYSNETGGHGSENYFGKTRQEEVGFSHKEAKKFAEALVSEYFQKKGVDTRIVRLGDVYGPGMPLSSGNILANLIRQVLYNRPLIVPNSKQVNLRPVFIQDVVEGMEKALFGSGTRGAVISLAGPEISVFEIAQILAKAGGQEIQRSDVGHFPEEEALGNLPGAGKKHIAWSPKTGLQEGLIKTINWFQDKARITPKAHEAAAEFWIEGKKQEAKRQFPKLIFLGPLVLLSIWFFILPFLYLGAGALSLYIVKSAILKGETVSSEIWSKRAIFLFERSKDGFSRWRIVPGANSVSYSFSNKTGLFVEVSNISQGASLILGKGIVFAGNVLGKEEFSFAQESQELALEARDLEEKLGFLEADIGQNPSGLDFPFLGQIKLGGSVDLGETRRILRATSTFFSEAEDLLGGKTKKRYLILFQNNMELRPTGGFIGSFAVATFDKGRLIDLDVQDVYSADGQLKGHVEPPPPIKAYLGEGEWFLRDSNWSPNFPVSAQRAAWFIDKEWGIGIDGVIGVDLEFAKKILAQTGPIKLPDFDETITADNLYEKAQFAAEGDFFPGSKAKKNFLTALSKALVFRMTENPKEEMAPLLKPIIGILEERHAALWTKNSRVNNVFREMGWDGSVGNVFCSQKTNDASCVPDYLQVVEANLGVNKANYFLEKDYSLDVSVEQDKIIHRLSAAYKNKSQAAVWPGGDYKNYLRVFAPKGSVFTKATLVDEASGKEENLTIDTGFEEGKSIGGALVLVPSGETRKLNFVWETPVSDLGNNGKLLLLWQKQMGTGNDPVWIKVSKAGGSYKIEAVPSPSLTQASTIGYNTTLAKDLFFKITWQKEF